MHYLSISAHNKKLLNNNIAQLLRIFTVTHLKENMFSFFKSDPIKKLEKKKQDLLSKAHRLSHTDRKAADELMMKADEIEKEIVALLDKK